jgi:transposase
MKLSGGLNLHSNNSALHLVDENGALVEKQRMSNDVAMRLALLQPHIDSIVGLMVESTYNWYWLVDGLMDLGYKVHQACNPGHPRFRSG